MTCQQVKHSERSIMSQNILFSQATVQPSVAGSSRQESIVIVQIVEYSEGPCGPEIVAWCETPRAGTRKMTLPADAVEVYTVWEDEPVDYDRM